MNVCHQPYLTYLISLIQVKYLYLGCYYHNTSKSWTFGSQTMDAFSFTLPPRNTSLKLGHILLHKNTFLEIKLSLQHPLVHSKHWASFTVFTAGHASFLELIPSGDSRQRAGHNHCQTTGFPKAILCEKHLLFNYLNLR